MKAAIVGQPGQDPVLADIETPIAADGEVSVRVTAAALSHVTRSRASGAHYSSSGRGQVVPGVDGVGRLEDGRRVHFFMPGAPGGSLAETIVVPLSRCTALPDDLDDVTAAALAIPAISSWAALHGRAKFEPGNNVLVNGATGASGRLGVQIARHLGAGRVVATGRNPESLAALAELGADAAISLDGDVDTLAGRLEAEFAAGIDIVLDYLWGRPAETLLVAAARGGQEGRALRYVEIGSAAGPDLTLPSAVLRSSSINLMGSGLGSLPPRLLREGLSAIFAMAAPAGLRIATRAVPLADVEREWRAPSGSERVVFVPGAAA